jgi:tRNA (uracil-5-)-methyltransferase TRM9
VQDLLVPWVVKPNRSGKQDKTAVPDGQEQVFHRYYHLFVDGELEGCVETAAEEEGYDYLGLHMGELDEPVVETKRRDKWLRLTGLGWEMDNWWIMGQVGKYS